MSIDATRVWQRLETLAGIGAAEGGGTSRFSFTPEYDEARALVGDWMQEAGLAVRVDAAGNTIGRLEGTEPGLPAALIGSHIDTVPNGGRFDGPVGVLGGIEIVHLLREQGVALRRPLEVVVFVEEEGARFGGSLFGSRAMTGRLPEGIMSRTDRQGVTVAEAMRGAGLDPDNIDAAVRKPEEIHSYVEMHIEQGAFLDHLECPVGVVTAIAGLLFLDAVIKGSADHAGATPMGLRRDALAGAAEMVLYAEDVARRAQSSLVATVGRLAVKPGAINIIPGEVSMSFDIRDVDEQARDHAAGSIRRRLEQVCTARGLQCQVAELLRVSPMPMASAMIDVIARSCEKAGLPVHRLASGAGHDAQVMAQMTGAGMIFLRSRNGISHSPEEWTDEADIASGLQVLRDTVVELGR